LREKVSLYWKNYISWGVAPSYRRVEKKLEWGKSTFKDQEFLGVKCGKRVLGLLENPTLGGRFSERKLYREV